MKGSSQIVAFIPARGGSKSIPLKNIKQFCGKPLIYWNLYHLENSLVNKIVVATDSLEIGTIVKSFNFSKVDVYERNQENAQDKSSTESVMLEYLNFSKLSNDASFMFEHYINNYIQLLI